MAIKSNEWWLYKSEEKENIYKLHIGEKIHLEEAGITIPSFRYLYSNINDLNIYTNINYPEYCIVYSKSFPILDIWKYIIKNESVPGTCYSKCLKFPKDLNIYHTKRIVSNPYSSAEILYSDNTFIIKWSENYESIFDIQSETFIKHNLPIRALTELEKESIKIYDDYQILYNTSKKSEFIDVFYQNIFKYRLHHNTYKRDITCIIIETYNNHIIINDNHGSLGIYNINWKFSA